MVEPAKNSHEPCSTLGSNPPRAGSTWDNWESKQGRFGVIMCRFGAPLGPFHGFRVNSMPNSKNPKTLHCHSKHSSENGWGCDDEMCYKPPDKNTPRLTGLDIDALKLLQHHPKITPQSKSGETVRRRWANSANTSPMLVKIRQALAKFGHQRDNYFRVAPETEF